MNNKTPFIVFEGIDGSGKTTQAELLVKRLEKMGKNPYATKEPTDLPVGKMIRRILSGSAKTDNRVIAALFAADRLDHLTNEESGLIKILQSGRPVVCDRYYFSSYAYNGVDMPLGWVMNTNSIAAELLSPTVTVFVDVSPETALDRINKNRTQTELFENYERLNAVRNNFFKTFEMTKEKENVLVFDGNLKIEELENEIWDKIKQYF